MEKIMLAGLGPHSKRIYINYIKKNKLDLCVLIELKSKEEETKDYLIENGFESTKLLLLDDKYKDDIELPSYFEKELKKVIKENNIKNIICSVEPKAHNMYLTFALKNNINVLSDKPITLVKNMEKKESIESIRNQYNDLLKLYSKSKSNCKIMCQRQYHRGYDYIKEILKDVVTKYNIPITYIDIYHCDGNWYMPHDLDNENHPYKYGYGKLYHSGFHFIDLLAEFLKINEYTDSSKRIVSGKAMGTVFTPNDEKVVFNKNDFKNIFPNENISGIYDDLENINYKDYGEKNFYGQFSFTNKDNKLITTANLNLLHYGFSRRGWFKTRELYKKNGRIRHERINIQVGPLMNIQVHSYQSKEIKDRENCIDEVMCGGLEHFDIDIYRNVDLIGGKRYERIRLCDLYPEKMTNNNFIGFNELSREEFLKHFFKNDDQRGDLANYKLAIELLYSCTMLGYDKNNNIPPIENVTIPKNDSLEQLKCIKVIKDKDLGYETKRFSKPRTRIGARGIIINNEGKIAIFNKSNKNEYKLPGGGVDKDEDIREAFIREAKEETGCEISIEQEVGIIKEEKSLDNFKQTSYIFVGKVIKDTHKLELTQKEKDEGAKLIWVTPEEGLKLIKGSFHTLKASAYENIYHSKFIVYRDKTILEYYLKNRTC